MEITLWNVLAVSAGVLLILFWQGPNAVWVGLVVGALCGMLWTSLAPIWDKHLLWAPTMAKGAVVGVLFGTLFALLIKFDRKRRQPGH